MQGSQKQTYKLCHIFKERQEIIWGFDDDSELEDEPSQSGMLSQASIRMPTIQEKASDLPSSSQQVCSAEEIERKRASSHAEKREGSNGYPSTAERSGKYCPDDDPPVEFYEDEDMESSSEEEDFAFDASCDAQESPLPKFVTYRKTANVQAAELYRSDCNEMIPPKRDDRRMYRTVISDQGPDRQRFLSYQSRGSGRYHSQVPAGPKSGSPQQANTQRLSLPHKAQLRCSYSHQPTEGRNSSRPLAHRSSRGYSQQPTGVQDWSCRQLQPRSRSHPHHQVQYRHDKRDHSQATKMYILMQKSTEVNEMRSTPHGKECNNRRESTPPPVQQTFSRPRVAMVSHPSDLNTDQDREHQPLRVPVHRTSREEIYKERNKYRRRRIGVCRETDETKEHRMFVRVLSKRF